MPVRYNEASYRVDMAGKGDHEFSFGEIPELNGTIVRATYEEPIFGIDSQASYLSSVSTDNSLELPWGMPLRFNYLSASEHYLVLILSQRSDQALTVFRCSFLAQIIWNLCFFFFF